MALTDAEKKRRSRASKPRAYHDREREMSRRRMAIGRARNRAQKRASQLRSLLNDKDKQAFQVRAEKEKQRLVCHWFSDRNLRFDPKVINDKKILNVFMTKLDLYKIEIQVAEFEISLMGIEKMEDDAVEKGNVASWSDKGTSWLDKGKEETAAKSREIRIEEIQDDGDVKEGHGTSWLDKDKETAAAKSREIISSRDSSERNLNNRIDHFVEKGTPSSDICSEEVVEILEANQEEVAKQEEVVKPGCSGTNGGGLSERKEDEVLGPVLDDRLLEKEMEEVREILDVKQEEIAKSGYPGTYDAGELQRWDDEVLAAEAMAILQTSRDGTTNPL